MKRIKWPPLPASVTYPAGLVEIREVEQPRMDGEDADGTLEPTERLVEIKASLPQRHKWEVLFHELMHTTLADSGVVNLLSLEAQETLCDAVATARLVEMAGTL